MSSLFQDHETTSTAPKVSSQNGNVLPLIPCYSRKEEQIHVSWNGFKEFPTANVRPSAFSIKGTNKIIYSTDYDQDKDKSGIFEYDIKTDTHKTIQLWKSTNYWIAQYVSIYNTTKNEIIFVGGSNYCNSQSGQGKNWDSQPVVTFNLNNKTMKQIDIKAENAECGGFACASLALTNNDNYLHIVGGRENDYHIIINLSTNSVLKKENNIYSFKKNKVGYRYDVGDIYAKNGIMKPQLIYDKLSNSLIMLGGYTDAGTGRHNFNQDCYTYFDFWTFDLNDVNNNVWKRYKNQNLWKLPKYLAFTSVLYDNRIIINFGGWKYMFQGIDDILYMDIFGDGKWKIAKSKCPKAGECNVVIVDKTVHVIPWGRYQDHFCINIADLLPETLLNADQMKQNQKDNDDIKCNNCDEINEKLSVSDAKANNLQKLVNELLSTQSKMEMERDANNRTIQQLQDQNNSFNDECKEAKMELFEIKKELKVLKKKNINIENFREWSSDEFVDWVCSLEEGKYMKYENKLRTKFIEEDISGESINDIEKNDWKGWGIANFADRTNLQKHVNKLVQQNNTFDNNMNFNEEGGTAYI